MYTVLFTLKNATQYTLYTQKTILHFRVPKIDNGIIFESIYCRRNQLHLSQTFIFILLRDTAIIICPVQIFICIRLYRLQFK